MNPYKSTSGKTSGVTAYAIGDDFIKVRFTNGDMYTYSYGSNAPSLIEHMKQLAIANNGLSAFIAQQKPAFEK